RITIQVFKEGKEFVAHTPELDILSCGDTEATAFHNLKEAVTLFLEEADKMGTLNQILDEAGLFKHADKLEGPKLVSTQRSPYLSLCCISKKLSPVSYKQLRMVFEGDGFRLVREQGDHMVFTKPGVIRPVVIPKSAAVPVFHH